MGSGCPHSLEASSEGLELTEQGLKFGVFCTDCPFKSTAVLETPSLLLILDGVLEAGAFNKAIEVHGIDDFDDIPS